MKRLFSVKIPKFDYWKEQIKCQSACPVHTDARGYVKAVADGDYERAYLIARAPNPLASICGRVCAAPCEAACRRSDIDQAVSIRALKRFAASSYGPIRGAGNVQNLIRQIEADSTKKVCSDHEELSTLRQVLGDLKMKTPDGPGIGIIGSGPAGLAAAHDLALMGFRPVIYEMEPVAAGMLHLGVPEYRLPREIIKAEVAVIEALGVEIKCGMQVGKNISLDDLRKEHEAVLIAVGAKKGRMIPIPGIDSDGVVSGIDFLRDVALGLPVKLGTKVTVIGGGNVAYDVGRTAVRQEGYDVSRTAMRQASVRDVNLCCLESRQAMLADEVEIIEGEEEGIRRYNSIGPREIIVENGKVKAVVFKKVLSIFDENGRFAPTYDENSLTTIETDTVLIAIGQASDLSFIDKNGDVKVNERGQLELDKGTFVTSAPNVFAAGDVAYGARLMIDAVASGKKAARAIYTHLTGNSVEKKSFGFFTPITSYQREAGYELLRRKHPKTLNAEQRRKSQNLEVEKQFENRVAEEQGARCLLCNIQTIFDGERCVLCGGCVDVCPEKCLRLVPVMELAGDDELKTLKDAYNGMEGMDVEDMSAIVKDEERCIRCGLCAKRCPAGAITMETFHFKEETLVKAK